MKHVAFDTQVNDYDTLHRLVLPHLLAVNGAKTPGYPLNLVHQTNHHVLENDFELVLGASIARLHLWLTADEETISWVTKDPFLAVKMGFVDPSTIFIKDEPHPHRKVKDGRYRCITPVSIVDQVVEATLFSEMSAKRKEGGALFASGSAVGIGFTDRQHKEFASFLYKDDRPVVSDDVSGFDALHTEQMLDATAELDRAQYVTVLPAECWWRAHALWAKLSAKSVSVFGEYLYGKSIPGMINSGSRDTSRRNTSLRILYGMIIAATLGDNYFVMANGDDACTWGVKDLDEYLKTAESYGINLRDAMQSRDIVEFCSHRYIRGDPAVPLTSYAKSVYRLLTSAEVDPFDARQCVEEMRHNVEYETVRKWVDIIAPL